jgi:hypothetical protein
VLGDRAVTMVMDIQVAYPLIVPRKVFQNPDVLSIHESLFG